MQRDRESEVHVEEGMEWEKDKKKVDGKGRGGMKI